jgi:transposase
MRARDADDVLAEIENKMQMGITRFGFYEDNALALRGHLKEILEEIIRRKHRLTLYAPEGFETRMLTKDLLHAMKRAGFEKIHLPFEALKMDTNLGWNRRHASTASFEQAFDAAVEAGFRPRTEQINAFVLFGLPDEKLEDILDSVTYVHHTVGSIIPMLFTPVPGTHIYREHEQYLREQMGWDLQHLNGKFLPFLEYNRQHYPTLRASDYLELESLMSILNDGKFLSRAMNLCDENTASQAFRDTLVETPKRRSLTTDSGNILPDEIWRRVDPILPAPPQGRSNGKPHVTNRQALNGVLYVLKTGISWDKLPKNLGYGSGITCWRRLKLWQERGAWIETQRILQATLANTALIDWERVAIE